MYTFHLKWIHDRVVRLFFVLAMKPGFEYYHCRYVRMVSQRASPLEVPETIPRVDLKP